MALRHANANLKSHMASHAPGLRRIFGLRLTTTQSTTCLRELIRRQQHVGVLGRRACVVKCLEESVSEAVLRDMLFRRVEPTDTLKVGVANFLQPPAAKCW